MLETVEVTVVPLLLAPAASASPSWLTCCNCALKTLAGVVDVAAPLDGLAFGLPPAAGTFPAAEPVAEAERLAEDGGGTGDVCPAWLLWTEGIAEP
ncbi:hypothetical protein [Marinobacterium sediminicola]|uniref:Secreted protein n=1 Tax=Marinobacterium sediminicola TaxID=518898 RepID=A0ABY1RYE1_9GAMM|nr:hypothetical protein [Marinobacterium sediminicola]ULG68744.1 hypothetical protein LN244_13755 [Marinobacterium sediminicola]SMR73273.1 hypothetical protein SAMN04487964_103216 [Marinobacterium sediminicola]